AASAQSDVRVSESSQARQTFPLKSRRPEWGGRWDRPPTSNPPAMRPPLVGKAGRRHPFLHGYYIPFEKTVPTTLDVYYGESGGPDRQYLLSNHGRSPPNHR